MAQTIHSWHLPNSKTIKTLRNCYADSTHPPGDCSLGTGSKVWNNFRSALKNSITSQYNKRFFICRQESYKCTVSHYFFIIHWELQISPVKLNLGLKQTENMTKTAWNAFILSCKPMKVFWSFCQMFLYFCTHHTSHINSYAK